MDFNGYIDNDHDPSDDVQDIPLFASEALYRTNFHACRSALVQFKQDQAMVDGNDGAIEEESAG